MMIRASQYAIALFASLLLLSGCASLTTKLDPPRVTLENFRSLPSDGGGPRFEIKLRVQNPNEQSLDIAGISYTIELLGKEVMSGVSNDIPLIEGYTEEVVTLEAGLQLFQILRLLTSLGQTPTDALEYRFVAKIDFKGLLPTQRVEKIGEITLN